MPDQDVAALIAEARKIGSGIEHDWPSIELTHALADALERCETERAQLEEERDRWREACQQITTAGTIAEAERARLEKLAQEGQNESVRLHNEVVRLEADLEKSEAERARLEEERDYAISQHEGLLARTTRLEEWASRMPDAGFTDQDPRWAWWHERPR